MKYYRLIIFLLSLTVIYSASLIHAESIDQDKDGLADEQEVAIYGTDPTVADTDGDGFADGEEITNNYSPLAGNKTVLKSLDTDKDGLPDDWEIKLSTNVKNPDTDGDGFKDGEEVNSGHDPLSSKADLIPKTIRVDLKTQTLEYSFASTTLDSFKISSGLKYTPTPVGSFTILKKRPTVHYGGANYDYPNTKWNLLFLQKKYGYYIHGAYWHNKFGQPMSHGCVNVSYANMERLYNWADLNTTVVIR
jgi:lipoprotein-anchoring transpeptidase ErfK/SrfK